MPKKTKKEKILAMRHRQQGTIASLSPSARTQLSPVSHTSAPSYVFQSARSEHVTPVAVDMTERDYIRKDLVRTLALSLVAITVEVILYMRLGR